MISDTKSDSYLTFGEFVEIVCQFSFFEQLDLLRYIFNVLDADKLGKVEKVMSCKSHNMFTVPSEGSLSDLN